jgi:hypothetical protein
MDFKDPYPQAIRTPMRVMILSIVLLLPPSVLPAFGQTAWPDLDRRYSKELEEFGKLFASIELATASIPYCETTRDATWTARTGEKMQWRGSEMLSGLKTYTDLCRLKYLRLHEHLIARDTSMRAFLQH